MAVSVQKWLVFLNEEGQHGDADIDHEAEHIKEPNSVDFSVVFEFESDTRKVEQLEYLANQYYYAKPENMAGGVAVVVK